MCCELADNKGEDSLRNVLTSLGVTSLTEMAFVKGLKEKTKNDIIQINDFFDYMEKYWSQKESIRQNQINLFNKYFSATLGSSGSREINIYEISLLFLPLFNIPIEEKRKAFEYTIKTLTFQKLLFKNIKEMITLYYNFHTIFITKIIYCEFKNENRKKESEDLKGLLHSVFNEENVHKELGAMIKEFEDDINMKAYLTNNDLSILSQRVSLNINDLRDFFINKYYSV